MFLIFAIESAKDTFKARSAGGCRSGNRQPRLHPVVLLTTLQCLTIQTIVRKKFEQKKFNCSVPTDMIRNCNFEACIAWSHFHHLSRKMSRHHTQYITVSCNDPQIIFCLRSRVCINGAVRRRTILLRHGVRMEFLQFFHAYLLSQIYSSATRSIGWFKNILLSDFFPFIHWNITKSVGDWNNVMV